MAQTAASSIIRQIESIFDGGSVAGLSDRQLLERFTAGRDATGDAAFAALVVRHAPMVLHVCRQVIGDQHRTEDAFQVVFIVLAQMLALSAIRTCWQAGCTESLSAPLARRRSVIPRSATARTEPLSAAPICDSSST